jgi:hypothetical protein
MDGMCATVHHSVLCMILWIPFEVPLRDPTVSYYLSQLTTLALAQTIFVYRGR